MSVSTRHCEPPLIVSLDIGSSSVRAMVFDRAGLVVDDLHSELQHQVTVTPDGCAVLDADALVERTISCLDALIGLKKFKHLRKHVAAVGCSMFMHSLVGTDRSGRACTPLYMWSDTRSRAALARSSRKLNRAQVHQRTGCPLHTSFPLAKLLWLRRSHRSLFRRVHRWLSMGDYLHLQLFGKPTLSYSMASGSGLFSYPTLRWDSSLLATLGLRAAQLGELVDFDQANRGLRSEFRKTLGHLADLPWFPVMGDAICSNIGSDCVNDSRLALNLGTSGAMRAVFHKPQRQIPEGLFCYVVDKHRRLLGGAISNCGNLRRWLFAILQIDKRKKTEKALAAMRPDSHGLTMLPFLAGERAPFWPNDVTGALVGLRSATRPLDIARAGFDAVCYQLALIHERLVIALPRAKTIVVSGGGSSSDWWMQMMADTMNTTIERSKIAEASSRGAALLALEALGVRRREESVAASDKVFRPNTKRGQNYRRALERYKTSCQQWSKE